MGDRDKLIASKLLSFVITFLGLIFIAVNESIKSDGTLFMIGLILVIGGFVCHFLFYKCPYCGTVLNARGRTPHYCPHCGEEFW